MRRGPINTRRGLRPDELPRRYRRRHDRPEPDRSLYDDNEDWVYDPYWDPSRQSTELDFHLEQLWHDIVDIVFGSPLDLSRVTGAGAQPAPPAADAPAPPAGDRLAEALHDHIRVVTSRETQAQAIARARLAVPHEQLRVARRREPTLMHWMGQHRGPSTMLMLFAPFWVRPVASWSPPPGADDDAVTRSLVAHLFGRYPIPDALVSPWLDTAVPSLKWTSWLVLIGGGASLRRAAARFGWRISSQLVHHLLEAPPGLEPVDAVMWAELAQRGGTTRELDRLRHHRGYVIDPTEPCESDGAGTRESFRAFWFATVDWLVRHGDAMTDDTCAVVLDWALHRHTEDVARDVPAPRRFTWRGRTPNGTAAAAVEYQRLLHGGPSRNPDLSWKSRGWDWNHTEGARSWVVRELTTTRELVEESATMHHCVSSYCGRCAAGSSAIFSLQLDGKRVLTVELDPRTCRMVQARGVNNRAARADEHAILARWLEALEQLHAREE